MLFRSLRPGRYRLARDRRVLPTGAQILIDRADDLVVELAEGDEFRAVLPALAFERAALRGGIEGFGSALSFQAAASFEPGGGFEEYRILVPVGRDGTFLLSPLPRTPEAVTVEILTDVGGARTVGARTELKLEAGAETLITLTRTRFVQADGP